MKQAKLFDHSQTTKSVLLNQFLYLYKIIHSFIHLKYEPGSGACPGNTECKVGAHLVWDSNPSQGTMSMHTGTI